MKKWAIFLLPCILALTACGGGGSGDDDNGDDSSDGGGGGTPGIALPTDLQQGDFWEFYWFDSTSTFAQGSGTDTDTDYGIFTVTLGAPTTVNGLAAYPISIAGDAGPYLPRWTHVAIDADGSILGSTDGLNFETIYDAASGEWNGGGFFHDFGSNPVAASSGSFSGEYNSASAVRVGYNDAEGGCETILGITICDDTSTTFSFYEYYKPGVGPIGFRQDTTYTSGGGGFFTAHTIRKTVELIDTSETATDATVFNRPDWEEVAPMSTARRSPRAAVLDGEIWVMGGNDGTTFYTSVEIYNPATNQWRAGPSTPTTGGSVARTVDGKIYLESSANADQVHVYDPNVGSWATITEGSASTSGSFGGGDAYFDFTFGFGDVILGVETSSCLDAAATVVGYSVTTNQWLTGSDRNIYEMLRPSVTIVGDTLYIIGGFGGFSSSDRRAQDWVIQYDLTTDVWDTTSAADMPTARDDLATVELNGQIVALGGRAVSCSGTCLNETCNFGITYRRVESYDPVGNSWTELGSMLNPRQNHAVVELNGQLYAIGGYDGEDELASVERYTPP